MIATSNIARIRMNLMETRVQPRVIPPVQAYRTEITRLTAAGIVLQHAQGIEALNQTFMFLTEGSTRTIIEKKLIQLPCTNLQFTIRGRVDFDINSFSNMTDSIFKMASRYPQLRGVIIEAKSGGIDVTPETWDGPAPTLKRVGKLKAQAQDLKNKLLSLIVLNRDMERIIDDAEKTTAEKLQEIESCFAEVLLRHLGASVIKTYNVSDELTVTPYKRFNLAGDLLNVQTDGEFASHFNGGLTPLEYAHEAMGTILSPDQRSPILVVAKPEVDPRCQTVTGEPLESGPFVAIREETEGKPRRIYIVEVKDPEKIAAENGQKPISNFIKLIHSAVLDAKARLLQSEIDRIIQDLGQAITGISSEPGKMEAIPKLNDIFRRVINRIHELFEIGNTAVDRVSLILPEDNLFEDLDSEPDNLIVAESWQNLNILPIPRDNRLIPKEVDGKTPISWIIYEKGIIARCTAPSHFEVKKVNWSNDGKGSMLGLPIFTRRKSGQPQVKGVLTVMSPNRNAFTKAHEKLLHRITQMLGLAISKNEMIRYQLSLDQNFGVARSKEYALQILPQFMGVSSRTGELLSASFFDIDHFKALNSLLGHTIVDRMLRPFIEHVNNLVRNRGKARERDVFIRYGGDEFVIIYPKVGLSRAADISERLRQAIEGKEFNIELAFGTDERDALAMYQRINEAALPSIRDCRLVSPDKSHRGWVIELTIGVTVSMAVGVPHLSEKESAEAYLTRLSVHLDTAKQAGRNRVILADKV